MTCIPTSLSKNIPIISTAHNIVFIVFIGMIKLCYDSAGSSLPANRKCSLQIPKIITFLNIPACSGPLAQNTPGVMSVFTVHRSIIHTVLYCPTTNCSIILISDNTSCKAVSHPTSQLPSHKRLI